MKKHIQSPEMPVNDKFSTSNFDVLLTACVMKKKKTNAFSGFWTVLRFIRFCSNNTSKCRRFECEFFSWCNFHNWARSNACWWLLIIHLDKKVHARAIWTILYFVHASSWHYQPRWAIGVFFLLSMTTLNPANLRWIVFTALLPYVCSW